MDQIDALPGLSQEESAKLKFSAENGFTFDDEMRGCVVRMIGAIQDPGEQEDPVGPAVISPAPAKKTTSKKASRK